MQEADKIEEVVLQYRTWIYPEAIMIKEDILKHLKCFDEDIFQIDNTITDYILRVIKQEYIIKLIY